MAHISNQTQLHEPASLRPEHKAVCVHKCNANSNIPLCCQTHVKDDTVTLTCECVKAGTSKAPFFFGSRPMSVMIPSIRAAGVTSKHGVHSCSDIAIQEAEKQSWM